MAHNPFTPAFGSEPLFLAGREQIVKDILGGLDNGPGDPNRSTILIGPRGSGKTVLLSKIAYEAQRRGWISVNVTAITGMLDSILEQAQESGKGFLPTKDRSRLTALGAFGVSVTTTPLPERTSSWRLQITKMLEILAEYDIGLLITVDEVDVRFAEMITLVSDYQHFVREKRNVALLMAGLPGKVLQMFHDNTISFIRRAFQHRLDAVSTADVRMVLLKTIEASGRTISGDELDTAAVYTKGFPFLIQLVGYHIWRQSPEQMTITNADVMRGIQAADEDMEQMILETTVKDISDKDLAFIKAMALDDGVSRLAAISQRMGTTSAKAGQSRLRLIKQGIIEEYGRGKIQFALPLLREYLRKTND